MDRRCFLRRVSVAPAALRPVASAAYELLGWDSRRTQIAGNGHLTLSSPELAWHFGWHNKSFKSTHFENRLSGKTFDLSAVQEVELTFSASKHRIDIPWWKFAYGPDGEPIEPSREQGLKLGFHRPEFSDCN